MILGKEFKLSESQVFQFLNRDNKSCLARSLTELNETVNVTHTSIRGVGTHSWAATDKRNLSRMPSRLLPLSFNCKKDKEGSLSKYIFFVVVVINMWGRPGTVSGPDTFAI